MSDIEFKLLNNPSCNCKLRQDDDFFDDMLQFELFNCVTVKFAIR